MTHTAPHYIHYSPFILRILIKTSRCTGNRYIIMKTKWFDIFKCLFLALSAGLVVLSIMIGVTDPSKGFVLAIVGIVAGVAGILLLD